MLNQRGKEYLKNDSITLQNFISSASAPNKSDIIDFRSIHVQSSMYVSYMYGYCNCMSYLYE